MLPVITHLAGVRARTGRDTYVTLDVGLRWTPSQPYTVCLIVSQRGHAQPMLWRLDRATLAAGCAAPAGLGDLSLFPDFDRPDGDGLVVVLASARDGVEGNLGIPLPTVVLERFVSRTYAAVPEGAERLDFDLAELLGDVS